MVGKFTNAEQADWDALEERNTHSGTMKKLNAEEAARLAAYRRGSGKMKWKRVSESRYWDMLEILPPAAMGGDGFLLGEPYDHDAEGRPRFTAFLTSGGRYYESLGVMTIAEFRTRARNVENWAYEG